MSEGWACRCKNGHEWRQSNVSGGDICPECAEKISTASAKPEAPLKAMSVTQQAQRGGLCICCHDPSVGFSPDRGAWVCDEHWMPGDLRRAHNAATRRAEEAEVCGEYYPKICKRCGSVFDRDVFVGLGGSELGPRYQCGSIYWPSQGKYSHETTTCTRLERYQKIIADAATAIKTLRHMADDFIPRCNWVKEFLDGNNGVYMLENSSDGGTHET